MRAAPKSAPGIQGLLARWPSRRESAANCGPALPPAGVSAHPYARPLSAAPALAATAGSQHRPPRVPRRHSTTAWRVPPPRPPGPKPGALLTELHAAAVVPFVRQENATGDYRIWDHERFLVSDGGHGGLG